MRGISGTASDPALGFPSTYNAGDGVRSRYNTLGSLTPVWPRPLVSERTLGIIGTGQSTASNFGNGTLYVASSARSHQINIMDGLVYPMADPTLGADGTGSSPFSMIGDYLIAASKWDRVTVANVAWGSTSSAQWADRTGTLFRGVKIADELFRAHGYKNVVHIHQQGEVDAASGTPQATMLANLQTYDVNRKAFGINWPLFISQTTFSYDWTTTNPNPLLWTAGSAATAVRAAQLAAVDGIRVFQGPDTDLVRGSGLRTGAHYDTLAGALAVGSAWAAVL